MSKKTNGLPEMSFSILDVPGNVPSSAPLPEVVDPVPPSPVEKKPVKQATSAPGLRQRGLHLSDDVVIRLRITAMKRGISASKLADQVLRKHLPTLADILAA